MNGFASIFMIHVQTIKSILIPNSKRNFMQSKEDLFYDELILSGGEKRKWGEL